MFQHGWIYKIEENLAYSRGELFNLYLAILIYFVILGLFIIVSNYRNIHKKNRLSLTELIVLILFTTSTTIGGIAQAAVFGIYLTYPAFGLTLSFGYFALRSNLNNRDYLTDSWNRSAFEKYLDINTPKNYALALLDLDGTQKINEMYGRSEGDNLLINFVNLVNDNLISNSFVVRYGGDKFLIYYSLTAIEKISENLEKIHLAIDEYNSRNPNKYDILYTDDFGIYNPKNHASLSYLIKDIESRMYSKKLAKQLNSHVSKRLNETN